jgi:hypothetical protein
VGVENQRAELLKHRSGPTQAGLCVGSRFRYLAVRIHWGDWASRKALREKYLLGIEQTKVDYFVLAVAREEISAVLSVTLPRSTLLAQNNSPFMPDSHLTWACARAMPSSGLA